MVTPRKARTIALLAEMLSPEHREVIILKNFRGVSYREMADVIGTPIGTARAIANTLGRPLIAPELADLQTFDESHLDSPSAERWSSAFLAEATPRIRQCLDHSR